jgi:hypothetical protein
MTPEEMAVEIPEAEPSEADEVGVEAPPLPLEEMAVEISEAELSEADELAEEGLEEVDPISPAPLESEDPENVPSADGTLRLELKVRVEDLPSPLREALAEFVQAELILPVEVVLKPED